MLLILFPGLVLLSNNYCVHFHMDSWNDLDCLRSSICYTLRLLSLHIRYVQFHALCYELFLRKCSSNLIWVLNHNTVVFTIGQIPETYEK